MEVLTDMGYESLTRYFDVLRKTGYKGYNEVYRLLALLGIQELPDMIPGAMTEDDLRSIMRAVNCLSGTTCLIGFPACAGNNSLIHKNNVNYLTRISQSGLTRISDTDGSIRVMI